MNDKEKALFDELLSSVQPRIYSYILKRLADVEAARDVLQETNIVIWRKAEDFEPGSKFLAWACTIARFQVLSYLQKKKRDVLVFDNEMTMESGAAEDPEDTRFEVLQTCMRRLSQEHQNLLQIRYSKEKSVQQIANEQGKTANAISKILHRCRMSILECMQSKLSKQLSHE